MKLHFTQSVQDAAASSFGNVKTLPRSVVRVFTESVQGAAASSFGNVKTLPPRSVVRVFTERRQERTDYLGGPLQLCVFA